MAREGRAWEGAVIYGDVVITGPPKRGESTEVDPALVDYFSSLQLSSNAVADWDVRNVDWRVTSWDLDRDRSDDVVSGPPRRGLRSGPGKATIPVGIYAASDGSPVGPVAFEVSVLQCEPWKPSDVWTVSARRNSARGDPVTDRA